MDLSRNNSSTGNVECNQTVGMSDYWSNTERIIASFILAIITTASVVGNSIVIYAVLTKNHFRNRRFALLLLLIVSDFLTGFIMMPLYFVNLFFKTFFETSEYLCILMAILFSFMAMFCYLCITTLALERYIMLKYPVKHRRWFTKSVLVAIVLAIILFSIIGALSPLYYSLPVKYHAKLHICIFDIKGATKWETLKKLLLQLVTLGFLWFVLVYCSAAVVVIIWKRRSFLTHVTPEGSTNSSTATLESTLREKSREIRSTIHIFSVMLVILGCCLPFTVIYVCDVLGYSLSERCLITSIFLFFCKSALDPVTNAFLHSRLRHYLLNILCCRN